MTVLKALYAPKVTVRRRPPSVPVMKNAMPLNGAWMEHASSKMDDVGSIMSVHLERSAEPVYVFSRTVSSMPSAQRGSDVRIDSVK